MERPAVDLDAAVSFLGTRFGNGVSDVHAAPRQGAWSRAYFFGHDGCDSVIRFASGPGNFEKDRAVHRYASRHLPIPHVTEIGEALGCWYAISERGFGAILESLGPSEMRRALPSLLRALDAMRDADVTDSTGFGPQGTWRDFLLRVPPDPYSTAPTVWRSRLATRPEALRTFDETHDRLRALVRACPEIRHLVHSDLLYGNVLVADDRVSAVFDWGCAFVGDFLYDLAWLTFWAPWYPGFDAIDLRAEALRHYDEIGLEVPDFEARLRCYEVHIGLAGQAYQAFTEDWTEFHATAHRIRQVLETSPR